MNVDRVDFGLLVWWNLMTIHLTLAPKPWVGPQTLYQPRRENRRESTYSRWLEFIYFSYKRRQLQTLLSQPQPAYHNHHQPSTTIERFDKLASLEAKEWIFYTLFQCNANIIEYLNIWISGTKYFKFEYEYSFFFFRMYSIFEFGQVAMNKQA